MSKISKWEIFLIVALISAVVLAFLLLRACPKKKVENLPPDVKLSFSPSSGLSPLSVSFVAEATDTDGTLEEVILDFGDGISTTWALEATSYAKLLTEHVFRATAVASVFRPIVTALDDKGGVSQASGEVAVAVNKCPSISFDTDRKWSTPEVDIMFCANLSDDKYGEIAGCEGAVLEYPAAFTFYWDFDGDRKIDKVSNLPFITGSYSEWGVYKPILTVYDVEAGKSCTPVQGPLVKIILRLRLGGDIFYPTLQIFNVFPFKVSDFQVMAVSAGDKGLFLYSTTGIFLEHFDVPSMWVYVEKVGDKVVLFVSTGSDIKYYKVETTESIKLRSLDSISLYDVRYIEVMKNGGMWWLVAASRNSVTLIPFDVNLVRGTSISVSIDILPAGKPDAILFGGKIFFVHPKFGKSEVGVVRFTPDPYSLTYEQNTLASTSDFPNSISLVEWGGTLYALISETLDVLHEDKISWKGNFTNLEIFKIQDLKATKIFTWDSKNIPSGCICEEKEGCYVPDFTTYDIKSTYAYNCDGNLCAFSILCFHTMTGDKITQRCARPEGFQIFDLTGALLGDKPKSASLCNTIPEDKDHSIAGKLYDPKINVITVDKLDESFFLSFGARGSGRVDVVEGKLTDVYLSFQEDLGANALKIKTFPEEPTYLFVVEGEGGIDVLSMHEKDGWLSFDIVAHIDPKEHPHVTRSCTVKDIFFKDNYIFVAIEEGAVAVYKLDGKRIAYLGELPSLSSINVGRVAGEYKVFVGATQGVEVLSFDGKNMSRERSWDTNSEVIDVDIVESQEDIAVFASTGGLKKFSYQKGALASTTETAYELDIMETEEGVRVYVAGGQDTTLRVYNEFLEPITVFSKDIGMVDSIEHIKTVEIVGDKFFGTGTKVRLAIVGFPRGSMDETFLAPEQGLGLINIGEGSIDLSGLADVAFNATSVEYVQINGISFFLVTDDHGKIIPFKLSEF